MKKEVIIMRGAPGSGKTTYLKKEYPQAFICSADQYFIGIDGKYKVKLNELQKAHDYSRNAFKAAILNNINIIAVDNTNIMIKHFQSYIKLAEAYGYEVKIIRIEIDAKIAFERNIHGVPLYAVERNCQQMQDYSGEILIKL